MEEGAWSKKSLVEYADEILKLPQGLSVDDIDWFDQDVVNKLPFDAVERYFKYFLTEGTFEWRGTQYDVQEQVSY